MGRYLGLDVLPATPRMQFLTVGEIIDSARLKTSGAVSRVDQSALPLT